jgi:hypothetical protein
MPTNDLLNENIIGLLGLESLPDNEKQAMLEKMTELIQKRLMLRVMDVLSEEDAKQMADVEKNPQEILALIAEKVPNFEDLVKEEVVKLKEEMLKATENA